MKIAVPPQTSSSGSNDSSPITPPSPVVQEELLWNSSLSHQSAPAGTDLYLARRPFPGHPAGFLTHRVAQRNSPTAAQALPTATPISDASVSRQNRVPVQMFPPCAWPPTSRHSRRSVSEAAASMPRPTLSMPWSHSDGLTFDDLGLQRTSAEHPSAEQGSGYDLEPSELPQPKRKRLDLQSSYAATAPTADTHPDSDAVSPAASLLAASSQAWADELKNPKCSPHSQDFFSGAPSDLDWSNFVHSSASLLDSSPASQAFSVAISHERR